MSADAFVGRRGPLVGLALRTSLMTLATLGVYRFWMKTRLRRFYWSAVRVGGLPLEYAGTGSEKLLGFLAAVVVLAAWLGLVNLLLVFGSLALLGGNWQGYVASGLLLVPLIFAARYRARRYILARTRWQGIRFATDPGAWGYAWRACLHLLATLLTVGLWWPRMTFGLEKYRTDRTRFGSVRLHQGGGPGMLYPALTPLVFAVALSIIALGVAGFVQQARPLLVLLLTVPLGIYGLVHYRVSAVRLLADHKTAGPLGLEARPRPARVLGIWAAGLIVILLGAGAVSALIGGVIFALIWGLYGAGASGEAVGFGVAGEWPILVTTIIGYFLLFVVIGALWQAFIVMPLRRHYARTLRVTGTDRLSEIGQVPRDDRTGAEGLAEALDVGAAI